MGAGAVGVEILVHLIDEFILGILEVDKGGTVSTGNPGPGSRPRVALRGDVLLSSASCADAVDGGLVKVEDELLVHVMELIIYVEDDEGVVFELCGDVFPPRLEAVGVGNDVFVEAAVIVWLDHGVGALARNVVDLLRQIAHIVLVEGGSEVVGCEAFHGWPYC